MVHGHGGLWLGFCVVVEREKWREKRYGVAGAKRNGGKKDTTRPARKDMAGKKIRRGRREKIWREKILV